MSGRDDKYGQQPAYNESCVPPAPPSYSEAVGAAAPNKTLYPVQPPLTPQSGPPQFATQYAPTQTVQLMAPSQMPGVVAVGPESCLVTCQNCHNRVKTKTKSVSTKSAHLACFLLCIFGCCLCSCIPYCMKSFSIINHYCPNCNGYIGMYKP